MIDFYNVLKHVDHTDLRQVATWEDIKALCDDAIYYQTASVCIPPIFVKRAKEYVGDKKHVCTVIGFPHGYNTTACKVFEAKEALANGADEIDMVININALKEKDYQYVKNEIEAMRVATDGYILKVIIETNLLNTEEKIKMCEIISETKADFIKTCTGFAGGGASKEDIELFKKHLSSNVRMKASTGINTLEQGADFIELGCERLGSRVLIKDAIEKGLK